MQKFKGWQSIFRFTFVQHIKTKSFIIGTVIMCVLVAAVAVLGNILPAVLAGSDEGDNTAVGEVQFSKIYLYDDGEILVPEDITLLAKNMGDVVQSEALPEDVEKTLCETEDPMALVHITKDGETVFSVATRYSKAAGSGAADMLNGTVRQLINRRNLVNLGISPEDYEKTLISVTATRVEAGKDELSLVKSAMNYFVPIVVSLVLFIFIYAYGSLVAQSIANEKTGRVTELLLTSVKPLAIVIGKVLAMGLVSFGQFFLLGAVGGISFAISAPFGFMKTAFSGDNAQSLVQISGVAGETENFTEISELASELRGAFSPVNILLIILIFVLGFLFFALLAALVGASVSRIEDLQQAMQPYALMGVLGMYLAYFPVIFNVDSLDSGEAVTNPVQMLSYFLPISSPFALPSAIMLGSLSPLEIALATAILALSVALMAVLVSRVYEAIILHNGNRLKFSDILKLAKKQ